VVDAREFTRIFAAEAPRVWRFLRRLGVPDADLEDVCQEVFLVVHRRWSEFRGDSALSTWVIGIALRTALAHRRRLREALPLSAAQAPSVAAEQPEVLEQRRLRARLQAALDALSEGKREVFVLYELEELEMREIARLLELPLNTCYSRLYAAREQLASRLRRLGEGGPR
jgi:RNA polymerase sigma-70 factor (ECF subfamily)